MLLLVLHVTTHVNVCILDRVGLGVEAQAQAQSQSQQQWRGSSMRSAGSGLLSAPSSASASSSSPAAAPSSSPPSTSNSRTTNNNGKGNINSNNGNGNNSSSGDNSAIIISTVDGVIYTLDAFHGNLRGMVQSGGPLVSTSNDIYRKRSHNHENEDDNEGENDHEGDNDHDNNNEKGAKTNQHEIIPGLDGALYSYSTSLTSKDTDTDSDTDRLHLLPVTIQDIMDQGPISTCIDRSTHHRQRHRDYNDRNLDLDQNHYNSDNFYSHANANANANENETDEICGLVMGQSSSKLIALDTTHGTVQWIHDTSSNFFSGSSSSSNGNKSSSSSSSSSSSNQSSNQASYKSSTVLLQREDYNIKHIDADSGEEGWRVHLGSIKALDVPNRKNKAQRSNSSENGNGNGNGGDRNSNGNGNGNGFRIQSQTKLSNAPAHTSTTSSTPRSSRTNSRTTGTTSTPLIFDQRPFPSVAFGSDGLTLYSMDELHNVLWVKNFESVISSVYGVSGDTMDWVDLQVLDGIDVRDDDGYDDDGGGDGGGGGGIHTHASRAKHDVHNADAAAAVLLPLSIGSSQSVLAQEEEEEGKAVSLFRSPAVLHPLMAWPLDTRRAMNQRTARIGGGDSQVYPQLYLPSSPGVGGRDRDHDHGHGHEDRSEMCAVGQHRSSLFVASPARSNYNFNEEPFPFEEAEYDEEDEEDDDFVDLYEDEANEAEDHGGILLREEDIPFIQELIQKYQSLNISHKNEHGLFLTWKMVALLIGCVLSGVIGGRYMYLRKKRKWILVSSPAIVPMDLQHGGGGLELESKRRMTPKDFPIVERPNQGSVPVFKLERAHTAEPDCSVMRAELLPSAPSHMHKSASLPDLGFYSKESKSKDANHDISLSHGRVTESNSKDDSISLTVQTTAAGTATPSTKAVDEYQGSSSKEGVSNIDGIPLVRYSRYKSEFEELSALGKGGFGTVFKCKNALDGREYAVKKVLIKSILDSNGQHPEKFSQKLERVLREVKILALLDHRNIVRYYTAWLEVEAEAEDDGKSPVSNSAVSESIVSKALSTDLLAGTSTFGDQSSSPYHINGHKSPCRTNHLHSALNQHQNTNGNPLGWNTFTAESVEFDESSCEDSRSFQGLGKFVSNRYSSSSLKSEEDLGFTFDRGNSVKGSNRSLLPLSTIQDHRQAEGDDSSSSSSSDSSSAANRPQSESESTWSIDNVEETTNADTTRNANDLRSVASNSAPDVMRTQKHILYIQMQLSQKTLLDYFNAREGNVDIPLSLKIFGHIARGVKHVQGNGLIHRDLKPSNCFMDEDDTVKIGDFGLSRESGSQNEEAEEIEITTTMTRGPGLGHDHDNTVGVGTSSYASPE